MVRADAYAKAEKEGKGSKDTAFRQKQQAWLAPCPGKTTSGRAELCRGPRDHVGSQKYLAARRLATSQLNGMIEPDPEKTRTDHLDQATNKMDSRRRDSNEQRPSPAALAARAAKAARRWAARLRTRRTSARSAASGPERHQEGCGDPGQGEGSFQEVDRQRRGFLNGWWRRVCRSDPRE
jgi:hypothetical protein